ncbi:recombinase family protein [Streptosporangium subroseum]|uniref:recombinase family protein n=1 Tax=Streptosporangium subroseum TaxID=106412 RepID=UPI0030869538|nr:recombinase family protein [Streptosporangium subroseum]
MTATLIGYARCSTDAQDLTAQKNILLGLGVPEDRIYLDHGLTGTSRARPGLDQALAAVRVGDTLVVPKLDRLARSVRDARDIGDALVVRAVQLFIEQWSAPRPDPADWEHSIREYGAALCTAYRRYPRALLVSMDEQIDDLAIHQDRLTHTDAFLGMLRTIGLGIAEAQIVHRDLALRVFAFVLLVDYRQDQGEPVMQHTPVPPLWLQAHPGLAVPGVEEPADSRWR